VRVYEDVERKRTRSAGIEFKADDGAALDRAFSDALIIS
jgi:hypothetical protein